MRSDGRRIVLQPRALSLGSLASLAFFFHPMGHKLIHDWIRTGVSRIDAVEASGVIRPQTPQQYRVALVAAPRLSTNLVMPDSISIERRPGAEQMLTPARSLAQLVRP
jgi:hypothetical protein